MVKIVSGRPLLVTMALATALTLSMSTVVPAFAVNEATLGGLEDLPEVEAGGEGDPGDPVWEGIEVPPEALSDGPQALSAPAGGNALMTNAVSSGYFDAESGVAYGATRSATPAQLFVKDTSSEDTSTAHRLPHGQGSWDMARSGDTLAIGITAASNSKSTWLTKFNLSSNKMQGSVSLPGARIVMSVVEDTLLAAPENGQFFWVGTYDPSGAKLFRVEFNTHGQSGKATLVHSWSSQTYVRSLAVNNEGLTIGLGSNAEVWQLTKGRAQNKLSPQRMASASESVKSHSFAYSAAALTTESASLAVVGTEAPASVSLIDTVSGVVKKKHHIHGDNTVDRIVIDEKQRTAWLTTRPHGDLYSWGLDDWDTPPKKVATPVNGSETRALSVSSTTSEEGSTLTTVRGITGISETWKLEMTDGLAGEPDTAPPMITARAETRDLAVQGITRFGNNTLVGGHWRYQVHGNNAVTSIPLPGEPKAATVVGDTMYAALYPSATVQKISSDLSAPQQIASIGNGQMRPAAIEYSEGLDRLAVATGPAYGQYGGGVSVMDPDGNDLRVYTSPVGSKQQVNAIAAYGEGFLLGTSTHGEAVSKPSGPRAQVQYWSPRGNATTGTTHWTKLLPVFAQRVTGMHTVQDDAGEFIVLSALIDGNAKNKSRSFLIALDPRDEGKQLWRQELPGLTTNFTESNGFLVAQIDGKLTQFGVTRSGMTQTPLKRAPAALTTTHATLGSGDGPAQEVAYVSGGRAGLLDLKTPRTPHRTAGNDRYLTAVAVSKQTYKTATKTEKTDTVLLARGDDFADALAAGPLAAAMDAPILLVMHGNQLTPETKKEIQRIGATKAIPVGGVGALPNSLRHALPKGVSLATKERLGGANRYETSVQVAERLEKELGKSVDVMAATGRDFADAVAAVPAAIISERAIVLYDHHSSARSAASFVKGRDIVALGGPAANGLHSAGISVKSSNRLIGTDRFDTSRKIAEKYFTSTTSSYVAPGLSFPDGLTAGVTAGRQGVPMLLGLPGGLTAPTEQAIQSGKGTQRVYLVGGDGVLHVSLERRIARL